MKMKTAFQAIVVAVLISLLPVAGKAETGPMEQLRPRLTELTSVLADEELKGDANKPERRAKIMDVIKEGFDFREMSKRILGSTWNSITPAERDHFTKLMTKLLENVYIGKLESYSGQTIGYVSERVKGDRAQVSTLIEDKKMQIPVLYIMSLEDGQWLVYDINIEGVSLVRNYMEQFRSILRTEQFDGLIKVIEKKNRSFDEGKDAS